MSVPHFRVLGPVGIRRDGAPVSVGRGQSLVLLTSLLLHPNRVRSPRQIAEQVWASRSPTDIRGTVQTVVSRLRKVLGPDLIETHSSGYLLRTDPDHLDLLRFGQLVRAAEQEPDPERVVYLLDEALALASLPLLSDLRAPGLEAAAHALTEQYLGAVERWAEASLRLGGQAEVSRRLADLIRAYPRRERLTGQLMLALYRTERRAEALDRYASIEADFRRNRRAPLGASLRKLHRGILRGDPELDVPAAPRRLPYRLPAGTSRFTGRQRELDALDALLAHWPPNATQSLVIAIDGTAGIGKTALAVHWARRLADRFGGGQFFVDLHGYDAGAPADPYAVLASLLTALGHQPVQIPNDPDALAGAFRSATAGRRVLIIADNARDTEHVRPLLPGPSCLLVVTSRDQLRGLVAMDSAQRCTVAELPDPDALALLRHSADAVGGESAAEWTELLRLCAGLPLTISIAGEYAASRPELPLRALIDQLCSERARLDARPGARSKDPGAVDVRAVLSWSYRSLADDTARVFRLLGLHPVGGEVGLPAVAALAGLGREVARSHLDRLLAAHLLEYAGAGRYRVHDLLRGLARDRVLAQETEPDREAATARLFNWYLHSAANAQRALRPGIDDRLPPVACGPVDPERFDDYATALDWFDTEHLALVALIRPAPPTGPRAAAAPPPENPAGTGAPGRRQAANLLWQLRVFYTNRAPWTEWSELGEAVLGTDDPVTEAQTWSGLGSAHLYRGQLDAAFEAYGHGLAALPADYPGPERAMLYSQLGLVRMTAGRPVEAITALRAALDSPWATELPVLLNLAGAYGMAGRFAEAREYGERALAQHTARGERDLMARALCNIAEARLNLGDHDGAAMAGRQAVAVCGAIANPDGAATALVLLGRVLRAAGDRVSAAESFAAALSTLDQAGVGDSDLAARARAGLRS